MAPFLLHPLVFAEALTRTLLIAFCNKSKFSLKDAFNPRQYISNKSLECRCNCGIRGPAAIISLSLSLFSAPARLNCGLLLFSLASELDLDVEGSKALSASTLLRLPTVSLYILLCPKATILSGTLTQAPVTSPTLLIARLTAEVSLEKLKTISDASFIVFSIGLFVSASASSFISVSAPKGLWLSMSIDWIASDVPGVASESLWAMLDLVGDSSTVSSSLEDESYKSICATA
mmetsp:Transcript_5798/g.7832  ORF Transcript_5798/g.7832 Transcript_5798/m.7832 type:complete len:233 (-) Transcript_5798:466-1164(-)